MIEEDDQSGFGERPMVGVDHSVGSRVAFYQSVLAVYGYRCAVSGLRFEPQAGVLQDRLDVVLIHPRELGGPLEISNALVLEASLAPIFAAGGVSVGEDLSVLVLRPDAIPPHLREWVEAGRALFVPEEQALQPAEKHLHFHRFVVADYAG